MWAKQRRVSCVQTGPHFQHTCPSRRHTSPATQGAWLLCFLGEKPSWRVEDRSGTENTTVPPGLLTATRGQEKPISFQVNHLFWA